VPEREENRHEKGQRARDYYGVEEIRENNTVRFYFSFEKCSRGFFKPVFLLSEVAFVLSDPFVVDMLARNAMSFLNRCVQNELLPRVN